MLNEVNVDLNEVEKYITSDKFTQFLLSTTTDFSTAAFVLQECMNAIEKARKNTVDEEDKYVIGRGDLLSLLASSAELDYLDAAGVDNWEGYGVMRGEILEGWGFDADASWEDIAWHELETYEKL